MKFPASSNLRPMEPPTPGAAPEPELQMAAPKPPQVKLPEKFPDMPWKKK